MASCVAVASTSSLTSVMAVRHESDNSHSKSLLIYTSNSHIISKYIWCQGCVQTDVLSGKMLHSFLTRTFIHVLTKPVNSILCWMSYFEITPGHTVSGECMVLDKYNCGFIFFNFV